MFALSLLCMKSDLKVNYSSWVFVFVQNHEHVIFNTKMMSRDDGVNIIHAYFQNLQEIYLCKNTSNLKCLTRNLFDSFLLWLVRIMHREIYFLSLNSKCHSARQLKFSTQILHPCRSPTTKSDVSRKKIF